MNESRFGETKPSSGLVKHAIVGGIFGIVIGLVVLLILSLLIAFTSIPESVSTIFVLIATAVGALTAGGYAANRYKRRGLVAGAASGFVYFVLMLIIGLIIGEGGIDSINVILKFVVSLLAGAIGGIIGVGRPKVR